MAEEAQTEPAASPPTKAVTPFQKLHSEMKQMEPQFKLILPPSVTPERFVRVAMNALQNSPDLLNTDRKILFAELMKCATDGLIPDSREAAIVLFKGKPKYMPMVGGLMKKARGSGEIASIMSQVVYENDEFEYFVDENGEHIRHRPYFGGTREVPTLTYSIAWTKDGHKYIDVMTEADIKAIRNVSSAKNGPWNSDFEDEMRKKSSIRRLSKRLPSSTDFEDVVQRDDDMYDLKTSAPLAPLKVETLGATPTSQVVLDVPKAEEAPQEAARPFNHAPGAPNPPPAGNAASPAPANGSPPLLRKELAATIQAHAKTLGWTGAEGEAKIKEWTGKAPGELSNFELGEVAEQMYIETVERNK